MLAGHGNKTSILYPDNGVCLCVTDVGGSSGKVCPVGLQVQYNVGQSANSEWWVT